MNSERMIEPQLAWIFSVLVPLLLISNQGLAQFPEISCSDTAPNYEPNSTFHDNLVTLFSSLSINSSQNGGFYNTFIGNGSERVYGRALCRIDSSAALCKSCLENASKEVAINCTKQSATIWLEKCQLEYSYGTFATGYGGKYPDLKSEVASDNVSFCTALNYLKDSLFHEATTSLLMSGYGHRKFSRNETLYGLVQCTRDISNGECRDCLNSAFGDLNGCQSSKGDAVLSRTCDVRFELYQFYDSSFGNGQKRKLIKAVAAALCGTASVIALIGLLLFAYRRKTNIIVQPGPDEPPISPDPKELPITEFSVIKAATDGFSYSCKIGRGGFGTVYKGIMPDGQEVAVKKLSRKSWQGSQEFKNEIELIAKLQHRNLVRLISYSEQGIEKLLIYEYMPNKSLDVFLFDNEKRKTLDWNKRISIIRGIAKGLMYLHEESRTKIVHRDLKPSNVLLDHMMLPKISDFGLARSFCGSQDNANTRNAVGTPGYMAPEYAYGGEFSFKSDVFSFGVILLEIISGKKNCREFHIIEHAWSLWKDRKVWDVADPLLTESCPMQEVERCIQIGLSCVQENPSERPMMSEVVFLLESKSAEALPEPTKPACPCPVETTENKAVVSTTGYSVNQVSISSISPR